MNNERINAVARKVADYVESPSLDHIRDPRSLHKLATEILLAVDRVGSIWAKWEGSREEIARAAVPCWIPVEDLRTFLNGLPGPKLTATDVSQRLLAFHQEPYSPIPRENLKGGCLALYEAEKAAGTELSAIIGAIRDFIEIEEERERRAHEETLRRLKEEEKIRLRRLRDRFLAGADGGWTQVDESKDVYYCRRNGKTFRITQSKDKKWTLFRVSNLEDAGTPIATYQNRRDANKFIERAARK